MVPGDIVLVQLDAGPRLSRYVETRSNRLRLAIGRNREARLPLSRVIYETGLNASGYAEVEALSQQAEAIAAVLDLEEVWDVVCDEGEPLTLTDIGELYWGAEPSAQRAVGILLHILRDDLRFVRDGLHFLPRDRETVANTIERRHRQAQRRADVEELSSCIRSGTLPVQLTSHQSEILGQIRGYVVHGEDYTRATFVRSLLENFGVRGRDQQRAAFDLLVSLGLMADDEHIALERAEISPEFPPEVLADVGSVDLDALLSDPDRADLTSLLIFTIDDADTRDRDDALSVEASDDGSYRVGVHITDAGALIERGSATDVEADRRMSSLYLPEQTISMIPPAVSADLGSLNPGERRAAVSLIAELTPDLQVAEWKVERSIILSDRALSYQEADAAIEDESHSLHAQLSALHQIARVFRARREAKGALSIDRDELIVKVDNCGVASVKVVPRNAPARRLVEEFMVLCNSLLAKYCEDNELPAPFRSQELPDVSDISTQTPEGPLRSYLIARRLSAAKVGTKPRAHGGLGINAYTQATSPLRRYADLMVQRQISHHLQTTETLYDQDTVVSIAHRADMQVRQMSRIENNRRHYFFLKWLDSRRRKSEDSGGESVHAAVVLETPPNRSAVLELVEWPFRTRAALPASASPGDVVELRLHGVDLWRRTAQFTVA